MSVYCNIKECTNWKILDNKVRQPRGRGYVPIGDIGLYGGQCTLNSVNIVHKEFHGTGGSRNKLALCSNFSVTEESHSHEVSAICCSEINCRFNSKGTCQQMTEDRDLYIEMSVVREDSMKIEVPACKSYITRKREGFLNLGKYVT